MGYDLRDMLELLFQDSTFLTKDYRNEEVDISTYVNAENDDLYMLDPALFSASLLVCCDATVSSIDGRPAMEPDVLHLQ